MSELPDKLILHINIPQQTLVRGPAIFLAAYTPYSKAAINRDNSFQADERTYVKRDDRRLSQSRRRVTYKVA